MSQTVLAFPSSTTPSDIELPLHRLEMLGSGALLPAELLGLLLGSGDPMRQHLAAAQEVLSQTSLDDLFSMGLEEFPTLSRNQIAVLRACFEIARRLARREIERQEVPGPYNVARYVALHYSVRGQEVMGAFYLDARRRLIAAEEIFRGELTQVTAEPRTILRRALHHCADSLVIFHTHPSGDPTPTAEDIAFTHRMAEAGDLIGVKLLDHVIVAEGRWVSLKERGTLVG